MEEMKVKERARVKRKRTKAKYAANKISEESKNG